MHLVVGLGNPGRRYAQTRHNAGFLVIDRLAERWGARVERKQFGALVDSVRLASSNAVLAKPQTFMNRSGQAVVSLKGFYKTPLEDVVVVHDEVDMDFGTVKLKQGGGHGGHNGLRDIQAKAGGNGFVRVRVGVSRPPEGWDTADWVLAKFSSAEQSELDAILDRAADAVELVLREGTSKAMAHVNARRPQRNQTNNGSTGEGTPSPAQEPQN